MSLICDKFHKIKVDSKIYSLNKAHMTVSQILNHIGITNPEMYLEKSTKNGLVKLERNHRIFFEFMDKFHTPPEFRSA